MAIEIEGSEFIEDFLNKRRIKFTVDHSDRESNYEIFIGSEKAGILLEYSEKKDEDDLTAQFWLGDANEPIYAAETSNHYKTVDDIEEELFQLTNAAKRYLKLESKLESLLDKMHDAIIESDFDLAFDLTVEDIFHKKYDY